MRHPRYRHLPIRLELLVPVEVARRLLLEPEAFVLEETPDFLQETPEHDRLWFEQKPPRDFDWDK